MNAARVALWVTLLLGCAAAAGQEPARDEISTPDVPADSSQREHVAPPPPASAMEASSHAGMTHGMGMDDTASFGLARFDQAEYREGDTFAWDADAWYGGDYHRLWLKTTGERSEGEWDGRVEALWNRVIGRWWSGQLGVRRDFGDGAARTWLAAGVEGLAPYFFDIEATAYASDQGRFAARLAASFDLLLSQRLVLRPEAELTAFSKAEPALLRGSGISTLELGLRLRYELRREFAPYAGAQWTRPVGQTKAMMRGSGDVASALLWVAGVRFWF